MSHTYIEGQTTPGAPEATGAYTPAVVAGDVCFVSGQSPVDPVSGELLFEGDPAGQTRQTLVNVFSLLEAAGFAPADLVSVTVMLTDLGNRPAVNAVYEEMLRPHGPFPARMMVECGAVPPEGSLIEIQAIAVRSREEAA